MGKHTPFMKAVEKDEMFSLKSSNLSQKLLFWKVFYSFHNVSTGLIYLSLI